MVDRRDLGSWMQAPDAASPDGSAFPGERLGRPAEGAHSIASTGRRFGSLLVDWALCLIIARGFFGPAALEPNGSLSVTAILVLENALLVATAGSTIGQRLFGVRVERLDGRRPGPGAALIRAVLLGLGLPAITFAWHPDRRGLHELASGTLVARR